MVTKWLLDLQALHVYQSRRKRNRAVLASCIYCFYQEKKSFPSRLPTDFLSCLARNGHMAFPIMFGWKWSHERDVGEMNVWLSVFMAEAAREKAAGNGSWVAGESVCSFC